MNKLLNEDIKRIKSLIKETLISEQTTVVMAEPVDMGKSKNNFWQVRNKGKFGYSGGGTYNHKGADVSVSVGTPVKSPLDGVVTTADMNHNSSCGATIKIDHGNNLISVFCHMSKIDVTEGQFVKIGEVVGLSGGEVGSIGAGNSQGPHLHWTIKLKNGEGTGYANPDKLVNTPVPVGDFTGMNITSGKEMTTSSIATSDLKSDPTKIDQTEEGELFNKIMKTEYLGQPVEEWLKIKSSPVDFFKFIFKMLDI